MSGKIVTVACNPSIDKTITVEKLVPFGLNRVLDARLDPGGKGINVAKVIKGFGEDVTVTGFIAGSQGRRLEGFLRDAGIPCDFFEIAGETRTNLKIIDKSVNKTTEINEAGSPVSAEELSRFEEKYGALLQGASLVVLSGSLPPGLPAAFYARCIRTAKQAGVKPLLDADGEAFTEGLKAAPYAVKPNIHELEAFCGRSLKDVDDVVRAAREILAQGVEIVIVSMGPDGAVVVNPREAYKVDSWDIRVQSPIGAGDSMVGALARSILHGASLEEIARITTAAGTITASKAGTELCTGDEVLASMRFATLHPVG